MYKIITDGSCDLGSEIPKQIGVDVIPFYVSTDGENYQKEIEELGVRELYEFMENNPKIFPKTSMPSVKDFLDVFTIYAKDNIPIICVCITSKFSGSYNSALNAKDMLLEEYPNAKVSIIDATVNTVLQGILVLELARMQKDGKSYDEVVATCEIIKKTGRIFFTIGSIDYLAHGGRIGKLASLAAGSLGIKPLILLEDGEISSQGIVRGRKKSKEKVISNALDFMKKNKINPNEYSIAVGYGLDRDEAVDFRDELLEKIKATYSDYCGVIELYQIGATIGVHTGPHPLGLGIVKKYEFK